MLSGTNSTAPLNHPSTSPQHPLSTHTHPSTFTAPPHLCTILHCACNKVWFERRVASGVFLDLIFKNLVSLVQYYLLQPIEETWDFGYVSICSFAQYSKYLTCRDQFINFRWLGNYDLRGSLFCLFSWLKNKNVD